MSHVNWILEPYKIGKLHVDIQRPIHPCLQGGADALLPIEVNRLNGVHRKEDQHAFRLRARFGSNRRAVALDALLLTATAAALAAALHNFNAMVLSAFPAFALPQIASPQLIVSAFPALSAIAGAAKNTLKVLVVLALVAHIVRAAWPRYRWWTIALGLLALAGLLPGDVHTGGEFLLAYAELLVQASVIVAICFFLIKGNLLAYGLAAWTISLGSAAAELFQQQNARLQLQGWILICALLLTVIWAIAPRFTGGGFASEQEAKRHEAAAS